MLLLTIPLMGEEIKRMWRFKEKVLNSKFQWILNLYLQAIHDDVVFHCSVDYRVELIAFDNNFSENFTLKIWLKINFLEGNLLLRGKHNRWRKKIRRKMW